MGLTVPLSPTVRKGEVKVLVGLVAEKSNPISYPLFSLSQTSPLSLTSPLPFSSICRFQLPQCGSSREPEPEEFEPEETVQSIPSFSLRQSPMT